MRTGTGIVAGRSRPGLGKGRDHGTLELIILIVVLLVLFGGGGGYYWRRETVRIPCPVTGSPATGKPQRFLGLLPAAAGGSPRPHLSVPAPLKPQPGKSMQWDIEKFAQARVDPPHKAYDVAVKLWKQLQIGGRIQRVLASY